MLDRGDELVGDRLDHGQVHRGREHVVRALRGVDVVVGVHRSGLAQPLGRQGGHAPRSCSCSTRCPTRSGTRRPGTRRPTGRLGHLVGRRADGGRRAPVDRHVTETGVDLRRRALDERQRADQASVDRDARRSGSSRPLAGSARRTGRRPGRAPPPSSHARCASQVRSVSPSVSLIRATYPSLPAEQPASRTGTALRGDPDLGEADGRSLFAQRRDARAGAPRRDISAASSTPPRRCAPAPGTARDRRATAVPARSGSRRPDGWGHPSTGHRRTPW